MKKKPVFLKTKDYRLTQESFDLLLDEDLDLLETHPVPDDLSRYYKAEDYISHTNANKTLLDKVYQIVRDIAIKKKLKWLEKYQDNRLLHWNDNAMKKGKVAPLTDDAPLSLLDIGAGTGHFAMAAHQRGYKVSVIEPNDGARKAIIDKAQTNLKTYKDMELLFEHGANPQFDIITLWHALEHVPNIEKVIYQLKTLLKPKGTLFIAVPNYKSHDANYYKEHWAAYDVPRHLWHFSQTAIRRLIFPQNMAVLTTLPMKWDAYYVAMLSEKYRGRQFLLNALYQGWRSNWNARRSGEYSSLLYVIKNKKTWF